MRKIMEGRGLGLVAGAFWLLITGGCAEADDFELTEIAADDEMAAIADEADEEASELALELDGTDEEASELALELDASAEEASELALAKESGLDGEPLALERSAGAGPGGSVPDSNCAAGAPRRSAAPR